METGSAFGNPKGCSDLDDKEAKMGAEAGRGVRADVVKGGESFQGNAGRKSS